MKQDLPNKYDLLVKSQESTDPAPDQFHVSNPDLLKYYSLFFEVFHIHRRLGSPVCISSGSNMPHTLGR
jgi:hypothetical protein